VKFAPDIPIENHWQHHSSSKLQYRDVMSEQVFQYKPEGSREIKRPNKRWIKQITGT
jgi:predicted amidophosphoribosyltransferase